MKSPRIFGILLGLVLGCLTSWGCERNDAPSNVGTPQSVASPATADNAPPMSTGDRSE
jgi:hypothetical protein